MPQMDTEYAERLRAALVSTVEEDRPHRRRIGVGVGVGITATAIVVAGITNGSGSAPHGTTPGADAASPGAATVAPGAPPASAEPPGTVVATTEMMDVSQTILDPDELLTAPGVVIVEGTITGLDYTEVTESFDDGDMTFSFTAVTIDVLRANEPVGSQVVVSVNGGYVPVSPTYREHLEKQGQDVPSDAVVAIRPAGGADMPEVGDHVLTFLRPTTTEGAPQASYTGIGDTYGWFDYDPTTNNYIRASGSPEAVSREDLAAALS